MMNETGAKHALGEGGAPPNPEPQRYYGYRRRATDGGIQLSAEPISAGWRFPLPGYQFAGSFPAPFTDNSCRHVVMKSTR